VLSKFQSFYRKSMKAILLLALVAVATATVENEFVDFVSRFDKKYDGAEEFFKRFNIFKAKVEEIEVHNAGNHTWLMGVNEFSDLTWEEFSSTMLGFVAPVVDNSPEFIAPASNSIPNDVDWRSKGGVTPIKNQGSCGSCWDFAGVGTIETFDFVKTGSLKVLSEQQVLDCSKGGSCGGGMPESAIDWGCKTGLCASSGYPYTARQGSCRQCQAVAGKCGGAKKVSSEAAQAQALAQNTVSIGVYIGSNFQSYKSGVFSGPCGSGGHAMVVTGNTDSTWTVKNSWGPSWGEQGYSRWARGKNVCQFSGHSHVPQ